MAEKRICISAPLSVHTFFLFAEEKPDGGTGKIALLTEVTHEDEMYYPGLLPEDVVYCAFCGRNRPGRQDRIVDAAYLNIHRYNEMLRLDNTGDFCPASARSAA